MKHHPTRRKGSLLVLSMVVAIMLAAVGASYVSMTTTNIKVAHANFTHHALLNPMESGVDLAMRTLSQYLEASAPAGGAWTNTATSVWTNDGWTPNGTGYSKITDTAMPLGNGRTAKIKVTVQNVPTLADQWRGPYVISEAMANASVNGASVYARQVAVKLRIGTEFNNGMVAKNVVNFNGNTFKVDSYNSNYGPYNSTITRPVVTSSGTTYVTETNRYDNVTVGTLRVEGGVTASGGTVFGNVAAGTGSTTAGVTGDLGGAHVYGSDSSTQYQTSGIDPNHISNDFSAEFPLKTYTTTGATTNYSSAIVDKTIGVVEYKCIVGSSDANNPRVVVLDGDIRLSDPMRIEGHVVFVNNNSSYSIGMSGNDGGFVLANNATLKIYTSGDIDLTGRGIININAALPGASRNVQIFGTNPTSQTIKIAGNGAFSGVVYAPNANVTLGGGGSSGVVMGSIIANNVTCNGGITFHYDEALNQITKPVYTLDSWVELLANTKVAMSGYGL